MYALNFIQTKLHVHNHLVIFMGSTWIKVYLEHEDRSRKALWFMRAHEWSCKKTMESKMSILRYKEKIEPLRLPMHGNNTYDKSYCYRSYATFLYSHTFLVVPYTTLCFCNQFVILFYHIINIICVALFHIVLYDHIHLIEIIQFEVHHVYITTTNTISIIWGMYV